MNKYIKAVVESYFKDADTYESDIQGFENYSEIELNDIFEDYCNEIISKYELDVNIVEIFLHGSRVRQTATDPSDLDVVVFYTGSMKEDGLFNILNSEEDKLVFEEVDIDFNPVMVSIDYVEQKKQIDSYKKRSRAYDFAVLNNLEK